MGDCVLQPCHPRDPSPLLLGAWCSQLPLVGLPRGPTVTGKVQRCSLPQPPCRTGCLQAGVDLGTPPLHPVPVKPSMGLEKMQELYGV